MNLSANGSKMQAKTSLNGHTKTESSISLKELENSLKPWVISLKIGLMMLASPLHLKKQDSGLKVHGMMLAHGFKMQKQMQPIGW